MKPTLHRSLFALIRPLVGLAVFLAVLATMGPQDALANHQACAQPVSDGLKPMTSDCFFILRAAVGLVECATCICDADNSGRVAASDSLRCLRFAVGQTGSSVICPACNVVTTSTGVPGSSTSSSSTSSTTTTLSVRCANDGACVELPPGHRCNPNNGICEKPCSSTDDCKDFFICDKRSQYCVEPPL